MSATKFPLVDRYELLDCKIFYDKEIFKKKDISDTVFVYCINGSCFDNSDSCWIYKKKMNESPISFTAFI